MSLTAMTLLAFSTVVLAQAAPEADPSVGESPDATVAPAEPGSAPAEGPPAETSEAEPEPAAAPAAGDTPVVPAASSSDASKPADADEPIAEIVVFGEMEIARRRRALNNRLRTQGYKEKKKKRDGTAVWRPEAPWKASVEVHKEGFVVMKRSPVRFDSYIKGKSPARWIGCIPPFIVMCVRVGGQVVSKTKLDAQKNRLAVSMDGELDAWKEAVTATSMKQRIEVDLPAAIENTWATGAPFEGGPPLPSPAERRAALLDFWATRACTPEGVLVSRTVADFLEMEVQASDHPASAAELQATNAKASCGRSLGFAAPASPAP